MDALTLMHKPEPLHQFVCCAVFTFCCPCEAFERAFDKCTYFDHGSMSEGLTVDHIA